MTLQQLEYIVALDQYRHFVRAAESCGITQSTLSSMIQKLEQELDITIFDRSQHPVCPTPLGEEILRQARIILFNASQMEELVATHKGQSVGQIRLGITTTIAPYILPQLFKYMREHHPQVRLLVEEARSSVIVEKVEKAAIDVAILPTPVDRPDLLEIPVYREHFVAYVSPQESFYTQHQLETLSMSSDRVWALREAYCPNSGAFPFCQCNLCGSIVYEAGSVETLVRTVDANGGYTIIPELHIPLLSETQRAHVRTLNNPNPQREIALVIRQDFVRERLLNILADAIKAIVPKQMLDERIQKFAIKL
ncbi:MAG: LysR family transcriptional regulator [Bacteroidales bacterium]|nr:LysR family transcriptional regulator [Bacteroidales bacterium]